MGKDTKKPAGSPDDQTEEPTVDATRIDVINMLRDLADRMERGEDVFVLVSGETFEPVGMDIECVPHTSFGGSSPPEIDPRKVLLSCIGHVMRLMTNNVPMDGIDASVVFELLGVKDVARSMGPKVFRG